MHLYIKGDINCFIERMYSMRSVRYAPLRTRSTDSERTILQKETELEAEPETKPTNTKHDRKSEETRRTNG